MSSSILEHDSKLSKQSEIPSIYIQVHSAIQHMEAIRLGKGFDESNECLAQPTRQTSDVIGDLFRQNKPTLPMTQGNRIELEE